MLPNTIGEPYLDITTPTYTTPYEVTTTPGYLYIPPTPLNGHYFVELEILSQDINYTEYEEYEELMEEWEQEMEEFGKEHKKMSDLGIDVSDKEPKRPTPPKEEKPNYKKINFNFSDKIITSWSSQWDKENEHEIIIVESYLKSSVIGAVNQYNVKMSRKDWIELITKLGAIN